MIVVNIDIWPHGIEAAKKTIGKIEIANDLTGTIDEGSYTARIFFTGEGSDYQETHEVKHCRYNSVYHLIHAVLDKLIAEEE